MAKKKKGTAARPSPLAPKPASFSERLAQPFSSFQKRLDEHAASKRAMLADLSPEDDSDHPMVGLLEIDDQDCQDVFEDAALMAAFRVECIGLHRHFDSQQGKGERGVPQARLVFVSSPYGPCSLKLNPKASEAKCSDTITYSSRDNASNVAELCKLYWDSGFTPIAPHLYFPQFVDDSRMRSEEHSLITELTSTLIAICDVVVFDGFCGVTDGMRYEIETAMEMDKYINPTFAPTTRRLDRRALPRVDALKLSLGQALHLQGIPLGDVGLEGVLRVGKDQRQSLREGSIHFGKSRPSSSPQGGEK